MQKWEYKSVKLLNNEANLDNELNIMGKDGWQLCSLTGTNPVFRKSKKSILLIFRRPLEQQIKEEKSVTGAIKPIQEER